MRFFERSWLAAAALAALGSGAASAQSRDASTTNSAPQAASRERSKNRTADLLCERDPVLQLAQGNRKVPSLRRY